MGPVPIYPPAPTRKVFSGSPHPNPLPQLLHTPSGLAILEMQGTINMPSFKEEPLEASSDPNAPTKPTEFPIGRLVFPDYHPDTQDPNNTAWMKRVYFYVGNYQRLTGEVKKLPKAYGVLRKRRAEERTTPPQEPGQESETPTTEELEIVEIVKYKIIFSQRPEPVGANTAIED